MIETEEAARTVGERFLDQAIRPAIDEEVVITSVRQFPTCWVVGFNTRAYAERGSISHALAGGGPIIINRATGFARMGTSAKPAEQQLDP